MKIKYGIILAAMISTGVMAQPPMPAPGSTTAPGTPDTGAATTATPPAITPPDATATTSTNTPSAKVKKTHKKKTSKKHTEAKTTAAQETKAPVNPLVPNEPAEAIKNNVVVRGQAHINSEIVGHLKRGDTVTVLEVVTLKHPHTDEPARWARIALPADMHVWVNTPYLDGTNGTVKARKLNLRTGPGENFSVIGLLHKGDAVKSMGTKGNWTEIEAPTNSFAFVAAHLLTHKEAMPAIPTAPPPAPTIVENPTTIAPPTGANPGAASPPSVPIAAPPIPSPLPPVEEPLPKRVVEREGIVGGTVSIQAPSHYELKSLDNGHVMDYLYSTSTNLVLKNYKGRIVHVSGEEELDERWPDTPVITIQKIQVEK